MPTNYRFVHHLNDQPIGVLVRPGEWHYFEGASIETAPNVMFENDAAALVFARDLAFWATNYGLVRVYVYRDVTGWEVLGDEVVPEDPSLENEWPDEYGNS